MVGIRGSSLGFVVVCVLVALGLSVPSAFAAKEYATPGVPFGSEGSGPGQFKEPTAVAANSSESLLEPTAGDVYVLDAGNDRVERFSSTGVYLGQFDGSGAYEVEGKTELGVAPPTGQFSEPADLAVDSSGESVVEDPSVGDVYVVDAGHNVVDKFSGAGKYEGQITGGNGSSFREMHGVAVDSSGDLWVYYRTFPLMVDEFSDTGAFLKEFNAGEHGGSNGLAVDKEGNLYLPSGLHQFFRLSSSTGQVSGPFDTKGEEEDVSAVAADPFTGDLLVDRGLAIKPDVQLFSPNDEPYESAIETFPGAGELSESRGIAVGVERTVYVSQSTAADVLIFHHPPSPEVETGQGEFVAEGSELLHGDVDPKGFEITECNFEYGTEAGVYPDKVPCAQTPAAINAKSGAGEKGTVPVSVELSGLQLDTLYHFRLSTVNSNGEGDGLDATFYTISKPTVEDEKVSGLGVTQAGVSARIDPAGLASTYRVEYGTVASGGYGSQTPVASIGDAQSPVGAFVQLEGLEAGTEYHFRFVASNAFGEAMGAEVRFSTSGAMGVVSGSACPNNTYTGFSTALPDCRAYEDVSGPTDPGEVYVPAVGAGKVKTISGEREVETSSGELGVQLPFRAATGGEAVEYLGESGETGGNGAVGDGRGNAFIASREADGWQVSTITPQEGRSFAFEGFTPDLSASIFALKEPVFAATVSPSGPTGCEVLYSRSAGEDGTVNAYHALFSETKTPGECGNTRQGATTQTATQLLQFAGANEGSSSVSAGSSLLFQSPAALTPEAQTATPVTAEEENEGVYGGVNLYDTVDGAAHLVNILPGGASEPQAVFGGPPTGEKILSNELHPDWSNIVSADGSRVFWTDLKTHRVYVRENPDASREECALPQPADTACTVGVSPGEAQYWTASTDGVYAFYTEAPAGETSLWRFDVQTGAREELAGAGMNAGEHAGVQGVIGASDDGSYVYFVADGALAPGATHETCTGEGSDEGCNLYSWHNGETTFIQTLAAGDNEREYYYGSGSTPVGDWQPNLGFRTAEVTPDGLDLVFEHDGEVYVYDAQTRVVNPVGSGSYLQLSDNPTFQPRWINEEGTRVFFDTFTALVPQDRNGTQDVYEWERPGSGSCTVQAASPATGGCDYLLSGGNNPARSYFIDADAKGENVFFTHRGQLGGVGSVDDKNDLFDARVDGGLAEASLACTGTGCQGVPPAAPSFATPASATADGPGNASAPQVTPAIAKAKVVGKCAKGRKRVRGKCEKIKKKRRLERVARKRSMGR